MSLLNTSIGPERVQVFPVPIGTVQVPGVPTAVTAFLISSSLKTAPVNVPTSIAALSDFITLFGDETEAGQGYYAVEGFYNNCGTGNTAIIVNVGNGVALSSTVTTVADVSGSLNSTYFLLASADDATKYYVWLNVNSAGVDPHIANRTGIMVSVATGASANTVATAIAAAINSISDFSAPAPSSDVVTITNKVNGLSDAIVDGSSPTGFAFATLVAGRDVDANDYIGNGALGTGVRALDNQDVVGLVCAPGLPMELAYLVQPAIIDYAQTVRAVFGATLSTTFALLSIPTEVTTSTSSVIQLSSLTINTISSTVITFSGNPNLSNIKPGMMLTHAGVYAATISAVNPGAYQVTVVSIGALVTSNVVNIEIPSAVEWKDSIINVPSQASAWFMNWVVQSDENPLASPGSLVTIDPVGCVAGVIARIDANIAIGGPSHAPAGIQFAGISGIAGLQLALSERLDAPALRLDFINRITSFPGAGIIIFGGYTAGGPLVTPDQQLIQVIRTLMFIKQSLESGLRGFLWENFSPDTQEQIERAISDFLRNNIYLFPSGLPEAQQFQVVNVAPTQEQLDAGLLVVRVLVKPNSAVRFIEIDLEYPIPTS